ncbi:hypothetical protein QQZ08_004695 [Neonectria magnoliae]|uniref:Uncharacterized protein n=1 Tax=Neonectria magnoliae TaxID=2732573 RepID=A0ABR1I5K9_9HYPO
MGPENGWIRASDPSQCGGHRDGMAAKFAAKRNGQSMSLVQKSIRVRTRMLVDKTVEPVAAQNPAKCRLSVKAHEELPPSDVSSNHSDMLLASLSAQDMEVDSDEQSRRWVGSSFSDFSNYLPTPSQSCESMTSSATTVDSQCYCPVSSPEDAYGWDAELERRGEESDGDTIALTYRRANGSKPNLLHRVFKAVSSSSLAKYD